MNSLVVSKTIKDRPDEGRSFFICKVNVANIINFVAFYWI